MADLETYAAIAEIAGAATIVGGVLFATVQIHQARQARRDQNAIELIRSIQDTDVRKAYALVFALPPAAEASLVRGDPALREAAEILVFSNEPIGLLVFERTIPLRLVDQLIGGYIRASWDRLKAYLESERELRGSVNHAEWYQWLAERLDEHPAPGKAEGAHVGQRDWRP